MDKLSKYFVELRNKYNFSPIVIQQQSTTNESNDSYKLKNIRPNGRGLADSTYIQRDTNTLLGLFSPFKFGLDEYFGYSVKDLRDHLRFLEVCNSRDGEVGGIVALFFDGATCSFYELPKADDPKMQQWYEYAKKLNN